MPKLEIKRSKQRPKEFWEQYATGDWWELKSTKIEMLRFRKRLYKAVKRHGGTVETKMSGGVLYFRIERQSAKRGST